MTKTELAFELRRLADTEEYKRSDRAHALGLRRAAWLLEHTLLEAEPFACDDCGTRTARPGYCQPCETIHRLIGEITKPRHGSKWTDSESDRYFQASRGGS